MDLTTCGVFQPVEAPGRYLCMIGSIRWGPDAACISGLRGLEVVESGAPSDTASGLLAWRDTKQMLMTSGKVLEIQKDLDRIQQCS